MSESDIVVITGITNIPNKINGIWILREWFRMPSCRLLYNIIK